MELSFGLTYSFLKLFLKQSSEIFLHLSKIEVTCFPSPISSSER